MTEQKIPELKAKLNESIENGDIDAAGELARELATLKLAAKTATTTEAKTATVCDRATSDAKSGRRDYSLLSSDIIGVISSLLDCSSFAAMMRSCANWRKTGQSHWQALARRDLGAAGWLETKFSARLDFAQKGVRSRQRMASLHRWSTRSPTIVNRNSPIFDNCKLSLSPGALLVDGVLLSRDTLQPLVVQPKLPSAVRLLKADGEFVVSAQNGCEGKDPAPLFVNRIGSADAPTQMHGHSGALRFLELRDGIAISSGSDKTVKVWDVARGVQMASFALPGQCYRLTPNWSAGCVHLEILPSASSKHQRNSVLDLNSGALRGFSHGTLPILAVSGDLCVLNPDELTHRDSALRVIDVRSGLLAFKLPAAQMTDYVGGVQFSTPTRIIVRPRFSKFCMSCALRVYDTRMLKENMRVRAYMTKAREPNKIIIEDASGDEATLMHVDDPGHSEKQLSYWCSHRASINQWQCDEFGLAFVTDFRSSFNTSQFVSTLMSF